jgi:hypothetical protein
MEKNFTVDQIKAALLAIQDKITVPQRAMLKGHSEVRLASMKRIAEFGGYASTNAGNLQYGVLCGRISSELGFLSPGSKTYVIAEVSRRRDAEQHFQWRMDDVVVKALKEIGWAKSNGRPAIKLPRSFSEFCVYTIVDGKGLDHDARIGGAVEYQERRRWTMADRLWQKASDEGKRMPILLGDATECSRLRYWGLLTKIDVQGSATNFAVDSLRGLRKHRTQELVLRSTRKQIAPNFIRPYAICVTPQILNLGSVTS